MCRHLITMFLDCRTSSNPNMYLMKKDARNVLKFASNSSHAESKHFSHFGSSYEAFLHMVLTFIRGQKSGLHHRRRESFWQHDYWKAIRSINHRFCNDHFLANLWPNIAIRQSGALQVVISQCQDHWLGWPPDQKWQKCIKIGTKILCNKFFSDCTKVCFF